MKLNCFLSLLKRNKLVLINALLRFLNKYFAEKKMLFNFQYHLDDGRIKMADDDNIILKRNLAGLSKYCFCCSECDLN